MAAKARSLRTVKALYTANLINADERRTVSKKLLALDGDTLAVLDAFADDLDDCAEQLKELILC